MSDLCKKNLHRMTEANTYRPPGTHYRYCRECRRGCTRKRDRAAREALREKRAQENAA